jgi:hypothetical protein
MCLLPLQPLTLAIVVNRRREIISCADERCPGEVTVLEALPGGTTVESD